MVAMRKPALAVLVAVAAAMVVVGCSDDKQQGPTKAEFVQRADAACDKWDARIDRAETEKQLAAMIDGLLDELDSLPTPEGDEERVGRIVASGRSDLQRLTHGQEGGGEPFAELRRLTAAYGLKACAASTED